MDASEQIQEFAGSVQAKAEEVASGSMTTEDFINGCIAELEAIRGDEVSDEEGMPGLGADADKGVTLDELSS